jgi:hypothetical protein
VVARKIAQHEPLPAIGAELPVAGEEQRVGEPRRVEVFARDRALDGEDRLGGDARAHAVTLPAAAEFPHDVADGPGDQVLGVISDGVFERDPRLRQAGHVDGQYQRFHDLMLLAFPVESITSPPCYRV